MAQPSDLPAEVASTEIAQNAKRKDRQAQRRTEALSLRMAGLTYQQIGERLDISPDGARDLVQRTLHRAEMRSVESLRELENTRLDRLQAGLWTKALAGDVQAVDAILRISAQRAKLNGLYAPSKLDVNMGVRVEMQQALSELESLVMEIIPGEVEEDSQ